MLGVFFRRPRCGGVVNPALSVEQVQLERIALADDHDVAVQGDVVLGEGGEFQFGLLPIRHPEVMLLVETRLQKDGQQRQGRRCAVQA